MADKLRTYNEALRIIGEQPLASLTDDTQSRYALDSAWEDVKEECLNAGVWNFALKIATFEADQALTPVPGYLNAIPKPADWLRTIATSTFPDLQDYYYNQTSQQVKDAGGNWHSDSESLTVEYISRDFLLDANIGDYTTSFDRYLAANLAFHVVTLLTESNTKLQVAEETMKRKRTQAKSIDARDEKEHRVRPGNWIRAQRGYANRLNRERSSVGGQITAQQGKI